MVFMVVFAFAGRSLCVFCRRTHLEYVYLKPLRVNLCTVEYFTVRRVRGCFSLTRCD